MVSGWLPYWSLGSAVRSVERSGSLFTDTSPFWYDLVPNQARREVVVWKGGAVSSIPSTVRRLRSTGAKVLPTVTESLSARGMAAMLRSPARRSAHVAQLTRLTVANRFDGLDLDYEAMAFGGTRADRDTVKRLFPRLVRELERSLQRHGRSLTVTVAARTSDADPNWRVYDYAAIGAAADRMRLMAYDYHTTGSAAGPVAPLEWTSAVVRYAVSRVPSRKVQLAIPTYGYDWVSSLRGTCPTGVRPRDVGRTTAQLNDLAASRGVSPVYDRRTGEAKFGYRTLYRGKRNGRTVSCTATRVVWFPTVSSTQAKAKLVGRYRLAGIAFWSLGGEDPAQWRALRAYARTL